MAVTVDLRPHVALPADLGEPSSGPITDSPQVVLLTGATGYLGAYLLTELLARSDANVLCLMHALLTPSRDARALRRTPRATTWPSTSPASRSFRAHSKRRTSASTRPPGSSSRATWTSSSMPPRTSTSCPRSDARSCRSTSAAVITLLRLAGETRPKSCHLISSYSVFNDAACMPASRPSRKSRLQARAGDLVAAIRVIEVGRGARDGSRARPASRMECDHSSPRAAVAGRRAHRARQGRRCAHAQRACRPGAQSCAGD